MGKYTSLSHIISQLRFRLQTECDSVVALCAERDAAEENTLSCQTLENSFPWLHTLIALERGIDGCYRVQRNRRLQGLGNFCILSECMHSGSRHKTRTCVTSHLSGQTGVNNRPSAVDDCHPTAAAISSSSR